MGSFIGWEAWNVDGSDLEELAEMLQRTLDAVEGGELQATEFERGALVGALELARRLASVL